MIQLDKNNIFASGSERDCYIHPNDNTKLIKIIKYKNNSYNQNDLEYRYYNYLQKQQVSFDHIAIYFGKVKTNLGEGLVFERIIDFDNQASKQLTYYIKNHMLTTVKEKKLLNELKLYLEQNCILFMDVATINVMCKKISKSNYKLIIIDGLGGKRVGFKSYLYMNFSLYTKYKIKKQWKRFLKMVENLK